MAHHPPLTLVGPDATGTSPPRPLGRHGRALWDSIVAEYEVGDPRLDDVPVLRNAVHWWLHALSKRMKNCFHCGSWLANQKYIGLLLLSTPAVASPTSVSVSACCKRCADLPAETMERAAAAVLNVVLK
jgi:hypothetical protein